MHGLGLLSHGWQSCTEAALKIAGQLSTLWARQACKPTWVDEGVNAFSVHAFDQPLQAVVQCLTLVSGSMEHNVIKS